MDRSKRIKESSKLTIPQRELGLEKGRRNFRKLELEQATTHLELLAEGLGLLSELVRHRTPDLVGDPEPFHGFVSRVRAAIELLHAKHRIATLHGDEGLGCSIDPSSSGFPVFLRDLHYLRGQRDEASSFLASSPSADELVEQALTSAFRGVFPADVIRDKLELDFQERLAELDLPENHRVSPVVMRTKVQDLYLCSQTIERMDANGNLPRFYAVYFKVTRWSGDGASWGAKTHGAIEDGLAAVVGSELTRMATRLEEIPGVRVEMIERLDLGPFHGRFTDDSGAFGPLRGDLGVDEAVITLRRSVVQRVGERKRLLGLLQRLPFWWNRDETAGHFSPAIASPLHAVLPHRLIQEVYARDVDFGDEVVMHGITEGGQFID